MSEALSQIPVEEIVKRLPEGAVVKIARGGTIAPASLTQEIRQEVLRGINGKAEEERGEEDILE